MSATHLLRQELELFEKRRSEFCRDHLNEYVLIKGDTEHGFYKTDDDALAAGAELFGMQPFLIKQVLLQDPVVELTSHYLGLIHATV
ncbi:hypothetical protein HZA57_06820 [Candidatus Poribacteria bacterium]|nr:hypothetical protein [Candidatus Poribacteria bacterium]